MAPNLRTALVGTAPLTVEYAPIASASPPPGTYVAWATVTGRNTSSTEHARIDCHIDGFPSTLVRLDRVGLDDNFVHSFSLHNVVTVTGGDPTVELLCRNGVLSGNHPYASVENVRLTVLAGQ